MTLLRLNALPAEEAAEALRACCASSRWVRAMVAARPFKNAGALLRAADAAWSATGPDDWAEAFAAHPRIGESANFAAAGALSGAWSGGEQSRAAESPAGTRDELAKANLEYERRFGRTYIVCATGRSGEDILADLRSRLDNPPERELEVAAAEQHRITRLRLGKLILDAEQA